MTAGWMAPVRRVTLSELMTKRSLLVRALDTVPPSSADPLELIRLALLAFRMAKPGQQGVRIGHSTVDQRVFGSKPGRLLQVTERAHILFGKCFAGREKHWS